MQFLAITLMETNNGTVVINIIGDCNFGEIVIFSVTSSPRIYSSPSQLNNKYLPTRSTCKSIFSFFGFVNDDFYHSYVPKQSSHPSLTIFSMFLWKKKSKSWKWWEIKSRVRYRINPLRNNWLHANGRILWLLESFQSCWCRASHACTPGFWPLDSFSVTAFMEVNPHFDNGRAGCSGPTHYESVSPKPPRLNDLHEHTDVLWPTFLLG